MDDFYIPLGPVAYDHMQSVFASLEFQNGLPPAPPTSSASSPDKPELSDAEMAWVNETIENGHPVTPAPTKAAEKFLRTEFGRYDFPMPVTEDQWRNFVLMKWYTLANDPDPKISKSALDSIAKSSAANLMVDKKEISITTKPTGELEAELAALVAKLTHRMDERVIESVAERM